MAGENDLIKLYSGRILALAADIPNSDRLEAPAVTVKKRSPLCGSTVTVDVEFEGQTVSAFGQDVKACALGQAAASVIGGAIVGASLDQVKQAQGALQTLLTEGGPPPQAPFEGLEVLRPAKDFKNRHASIMLALDAVVERSTITKNSLSKIKPFRANLYKTNPCKTKPGRALQGGAKT